MLLRHRQMFNTQFSTLNFQFSNEVLSAAPMNIENCALFIDHFLRKIYTKNTPNLKKNNLISK